MYYLEEEPKRSPLRKFLIFALLLTAAYFSLDRWSPSSLERIQFWKKADQSLTGPAPDVKIEPAPTPGQPPSKAPLAGQVNPQPASPAAPGAPVAVDKAAQVAVLLYHRVENTAPAALRIAPAVFEEHMQKLKDSNITVISMQDFLAWKRGEKSIPARSAIITIDDGFSSAFDIARPILKKFGYPWTCFVYTNFISRGSSITWEQLAILRDEGVEIGCHSQSHANLRDTQGKPSEVYEEWLKQEISGAKQLLEQKLGIRCSTYAYPFGSYSPRIQDLIHQAGYEAAFTLGSTRASFTGPSDRVPRYNWVDSRPQDFLPVFSWSGRVQTVEAPLASVVSPSAAAAQSAMLTQPMDGESIRDPHPVLQANLSTLGAFDPNTVSMRLSGAGLIPFTWVDAAKTTISAKLPKALEPGEYTATVTAMVGGRRIDSQWKFRFDPTGGYDDALAPVK